MHPLVVDLDGTLIHADMLHESALRIVRDNPINTLRIPFWLLGGKAMLKQKLASCSDFSPESLPYNKELLEWLKQQRLEGRKLILCTASDKSIANSIADYLEIFDEVIASDGLVNLAGLNKADALEQRFGRSGFDYIGNSNADLAVWDKAHNGILVNASNNLIKKAEVICNIERSFSKATLDFSVWYGLLRVHQWLKNLLLFVPILAAHQLANANIWITLAIAFISFSLCASSVYITNDLLDLENDRLHPRKHNRAFAAGLIPVWVGIGLSPLLLLISLVLASYVGDSFLPWVLVYFFVTCAYSWGIKRLVLLDCLTLAMLYTIRIVAGAAAVGITLSFWLLAFSMFLFLSLAFIKRYAELEVQLLRGKKKLNGRGYRTSDAPLIHTIGITSGYASVLILALYINSDSIIKLYRAPEVLWGAVPIMLFWINWMWMQAHRGNMHDDPLIFAVTKRVSLLSGIVFSTVVVIGAVGLKW